jgi:class 3 adenylate cyclase
MVYYFFPQPDCNHVFNALLCAHAIKAAMAEISKEWQRKKSWQNELYLNMGLDEGQEWLGTFQSGTNVEFTVLGDTINHAARLSDYARCGAIWSTKKLIGKLSPKERQQVSFGIRRGGDATTQVFVGSTYLRLSEVVDLSSDRNEKLRDIAALPITEIVDVKSVES